MPSRQRSEDQAHTHTHVCVCLRACVADNDNVVLLPESDFLGRSNGWMDVCVCVCVDGCCAGSDEVDLMDDFFWASGII